MRLAGMYCGQSLTFLRLTQLELHLVLESNEMGNLQHKIAVVNKGLALTTMVGPQIP